MGEGEQMGLLYQMHGTLGLQGARGFGKIE